MSYSGYVTYETNGKDPSLRYVGVNGPWFGVLLPGLAVLQNWYQGSLVHDRNTRGITESVVIYLLACRSILAIGVQWMDVTGLYVGTGAFSIGGLVQVSWLGWRARRASATTETERVVAELR